jgi:hypothetical protein
LDLANNNFDVGYLQFSQVKMRSDSDSENKIWRKSEMRYDARIEVRKYWKSG